MRTLALCLSVMTVPLATTAAAGPPSPAPLSFGDVMARLDTLPQLQAAHLWTDAALAEAEGVAGVPNPDIEARVGQGMPRDAGADGLQWGVEVAVPFDWVGTRRPAVEAARATTDATHQDGLAVRRELLGQLGVLFWQNVFGQHLVATLEETESRVSRLVGMIRLRVDKGDARPTHLPRIETELERVRIAVAQARADLRTHRITLALMLGLPASPERAVIAPTDIPASTLSRDEAILRVQESHPGVAAARARNRAQQAQVSVEKARRIPVFAVGGYFDRERDQDVAGGFVRVSVPVWNWNTGGVRRARAQEAAQMHAAEVVTRTLAAETGAAWERCAQSQEAAARFDDAILPRAEATTRAIERAFELGEASLQDVLDAHRVRLEVTREGIAAGLKSRTECTILMVLTGEIDDAR